MPCIYSKVMPSPVAKLTIAHLHAQVCVSSVKLVTLLCSRNEDPAEKSVTEWNSEPVDTGSGPQGAANNPHINQRELWPEQKYYCLLVTSSLTRTLWRVTTKIFHQPNSYFIFRSPHALMREKVGRRKLLSCRVAPVDTSHLLQWYRLWTPPQIPPFCNQDQPATPPFEPLTPIPVANIWMTYSLCFSYR